MSVILQNEPKVLLCLGRDAACTISTWLSVFFYLPPSLSFAFGSQSK